MRSAGTALLCLVVGFFALLGCAQGQHGLLEGRVVLQKSAPAGVEACTLAVETLSGGPVGEVAMIIQQDGTFLWELPAGTYDLHVNCGNLSGVTSVSVPGDVGEEIEITVR